MNLKRAVLNLIPQKYNIPARYYYRKTIGALEREFEILHMLCGKGVAIDIGGNIGLYSYALSRVCKRVEYFEPNPDCASMIKKFNGKNIGIHTVGLSSSAGVMKLRVPIVNGNLKTEEASFYSSAGEGITLEVPVHTLDEYVFTDVSFIKIDVEGHELEVLKGGRETILREKPVLLIEIEQRHLRTTQMGEVFGFLGSAGYSGYFYFDGQLFPTLLFSRERDQSPASNPYINNFIFFHNSQELPFPVSHVPLRR